MKRFFSFKNFLLVAVLVTALFTICDAVACTSVVHFASNIGLASGMAMTLAVPVQNFIKENRTISPAELAELALKYGKIKILTVVVEPPICDAEGNITNKGEFYNYAVKRPDSSTVRLLMNYAKQGKMDEYLNSFIKNLVVAGDTEILNKDGIVYLGFAAKVDEFLKPYESFLENA